MKIGTTALSMLCLALAGCIPLGSEGVSVQVDPSGQNQGEKNLEAVREIWADQRLRSATHPAGLDYQPPVQRPLMEPSSSVDAPRVPIIPLDPVSPTLPAPQSESRPEPRRKSPPRPPQTDSDVGVPSGVTVPPYTVFAPSGSVYPGSIRCTPDALGGQRCRAAP